MDDSTMEDRENRREVPLRHETQGRQVTKNINGKHRSRHNLQATASRATATATSTATPGAPFNLPLAQTTTAQQEGQVSRPARATAKGRHRHAPHVCFQALLGCEGAGQPRGPVGGADAGEGPGAGSRLHGTQGDAGPRPHPRVVVHRVSGARDGCSGVMVSQLQTSCERARDEGSRSE
jgi:hypothetical protein